MNTLKKENGKFMTFAEHLNRRYGKHGTTRRERCEAEFERFKIMEIKKPGFIIDILNIRERKFPGLRGKDTKNNLCATGIIRTFASRIKRLWIRRALLPSNC